MSLGVRISQIRRAACRDGLISRGQSFDLAERWCDAWEREAALDGRQPSADFWEIGRRWIDSQIAARRTPETRVTRR
jgi:hypothetical protein